MSENQGLAPDLAGNLQRTDPQSTKKSSYPTSHEAG